MSSDSLHNAIELVESGKHEEARTILEKHIDANRQDVNAWFWYIATLPSDNEKIRWLKVCLEYNPNNERVIQALHKLQPQRHQQPQQAEQSPSWARAVSQHNSRANIHRLLIASVVVGILLPFLLYFSYSNGLCIMASVIAGLFVFVRLLLPKHTCPQCGATDARRELDREVLSRKTGYKVERQVSDVRDASGRRIGTTTSDRQVVVQKTNERVSYGCAICGYGTEVTEENETKEFDEE